MTVKTTCVMLLSEVKKMNIIEIIEKQLDEVEKGIQSHEQNLKELKRLRAGLKKVLQYEVDKTQGRLFDGTN